MLKVPRYNERLHPVHSSKVSELRDKDNLYLIILDDELIGIAYLRKKLKYHHFIRGGNVNIDIFDKSLEDKYISKVMVILAKYARIQGKKVLLLTTKSNYRFSQQFLHNINIKKRARIMKRVYYYIRL